MLAQLQQRANPTIEPTGKRSGVRPRSVLVIARTKTADPYENNAICGFCGQGRTDVL
jgi:hypothetical protein